MKNIAKGLFKPFEVEHNRTVRGMTIIEILIVIALIGTIMTIIMTNVLSKSDEAKIDLTKISQKKLSEDIELYKHDNSKIPNASEGLEALIEKPESAKRWRGPYTEKDKLNDAWGNVLIYEPIDNSNFTLLSTGPDSEQGTDDDIRFPETKIEDPQAPVSVDLNVPVERTP